MKRFIQIVALVVVALLAAQPALATVSCPLQACGSDHSASNCCMHAGDMPMAGMSGDEAMAAMDSMSAGCQTEWHSVLAEPGCTVEFLCESVSASTPRLSATELTAGDVMLIALPATALEALRGMAAARSSGAEAAPLAAKYILFRDFRI